MTRALALALALLALSGQLAAFAHLVAVEHVACEHGELIDVGVRARTPTAGARREAALWAASLVDRHGHEHCLLGPMRRAPGDVRPCASCAGALAQPNHRRLGRDAGGVHPPIPLLLLAPKSSPPTAA